MYNRRATAPPGTVPTPTEDKSNYDDVLSNTGVDLKEETDNILRENEILGVRQPSSIFQPDRSKIQDFVDQRKLSASLLSIAVKQHDLKNMHPDCLTYLALATEERIKNLVEAMIIAKNHRIESENIKLPESVENNKLPIYKQLVSDAKSQLLALEKIEQEDERKRRELLFGPEMTENNEEMNEQIGPPIPQPRRKRQKKDSNANSALQRLTNEAIATKITNQTALVAAGGLTKSWMLAASEELPTIPSLPVPSNGKITHNINTNITTIPSSSTSRQSRLQISTNKQSKRDLNTAFGVDKQFLNGSAISSKQQPDTNDSSVTIKDALFVLERDRGGGDATSTRDVLLKGYIKWLR